MHEAFVWPDRGAVSFDAVCRAASRVQSFSLAEVEELCDEIFHSQPMALAHVLALSRQGMPNELVDHALHLLMVFNEACKNAGLKIGDLTEDDFEGAWKTVNAKCRYLEGETSHENLDRAITLECESHPEPFLLAYTVGYFRDNVLKDRNNSQYQEMLVRAAVVLLQVYVSALRPRPVT